MTDPDKADRHFPNYEAEGAQGDYDSDKTTVRELNAFNAALNDGKTPARSADAATSRSPMTDILTDDEKSDLLTTLSRVLRTGDVDNELDALLAECDKLDEDKLDASYKRGVAAGVRFMLDEGPHPLHPEPKTDADPS